MLEGIFARARWLIARAPDLRVAPLRIVELFSLLYFIQPFQNGNKRTADLFCSWVLCQMGFSRTQVSIITDREYELLADAADRTNDYQLLTREMIEEGHLVMDPPPDGPGRPRIILR